MGSDKSLEAIATEVVANGIRNAIRVFQEVQPISILSEFPNEVSGKVGVIDAVTELQYFQKNRQTEQSVLRSQVLDFIQDFQPVPNTLRRLESAVGASLVSRWPGPALLYDSWGWPEESLNHYLQSLRSVSTSVLQSPRLSWGELIRLKSFFTYTSLFYQVPLGMLESSHVANTDDAYSQSMHWHPDVLPLRILLTWKNYSEKLPAVIPGLALAMDSLESTAQSFLAEELSEELFSHVRTPHNVENAAESVMLVAMAAAKVPERMQAAYVHHRHELRRNSNRFPEKMSAFFDRIAADSSQLSSFSPVMISAALENVQRYFASMLAMQALPIAGLHPRDPEGFIESTLNSYCADLTKEDEYLLTVKNFFESGPSAYGFAKRLYKKDLAAIARDPRRLSIFGSDKAEMESVLPLLNIARPISVAISEEKVYSHLFEKLSNSKPRSDAVRRRLLDSTLHKLMQFGPDQAMLNLLLPFTREKSAERLMVVPNSPLLICRQEYEAGQISATEREFLVQGFCSTGGQSHLSEAYTLARKMGNTPFDAFMASTLECPWSVVRHIGSGASAEVFEVKVSGSERSMALKVLRNSRRPAGEDDKPYVGESAIAEYLAAENVQRREIPEITPLSGFPLRVSLYGRMYDALLSEIVPGVPLEQYLRANSAFPKQRALELGAQLFYTVRQIRASSVEHQDLHLNNLLYDGERINVIDYGANSNSPPALQPLNTRMGAPGAPDDLFSLGMVLYTMVTGEHLVVHRTSDMDTVTHKALIREHKHELQDDLGQLTPAYSQKVRALGSGLSEIVETMLTRFPDTADKYVAVGDAFRRADANLYLQTRTREELIDLAKRATRSEIEG